MNKILIPSITLILAIMSATAQVNFFHENDKEGLRIFMRQSSAEADKINAEQLGLSINDTLNWQNDETWIIKLADGITWNKEIPKRLIEIGWYHKNLAGTLNASKWTKLQNLNCARNQLSALNLSANIELLKLNCSFNQLSALNLNANTELRDLDCLYNQLSTLDLSANMKLQSLYCSNNRLSELNLKNNRNLQSLDCSVNQLTALNISTNTKLQYLHCYSNRLPLSELFAISKVLKNNGAIRSSYGDGSSSESHRGDRRIVLIQLSPQWLPMQFVTLGTELNFPVPQNVFDGIYTEFAITQNKKPVSEKDYTVNKGKITFKTKGVYTVEMTNKAMILPVNLMFEVAAINEGEIERQYNSDDKEGLRMFLRQPSAEAGKINAEQLGLEISDTLYWQNYEVWLTKIPNLVWNDDSPKRLIEIYNISTNTPFDSWKNRNLAGTLDASKWTELQKLNCYGNKLTALDISNNTKLQMLYCSNNQLTTLDIRANTDLQHLDCSSNQLKVLDFSANTKLIDLRCAHNHLKTLDVSGNTVLEKLYCHANQLSTLNLKTNTKLKTLYCPYNQLTTLFVNTNKELQELNCSNNQLATIDVSANALLQGLSCSDNQLTAINISANKELEYLNCFNNQVTTIDVSANTLLRQLRCSNNQLRTLDLSANKKLQWFSCDNNQLSTLDIRNTDLRELICYNNHLYLYNLFALSQAMTGHRTPCLGSQTLPTQTVRLGRELSFSIPQNVFNGAFTKFTVTQNGNLAPESDYTVTNGEITFKTIGTYTVKMTNEAIDSDREYPAEVMFEAKVKK